MGSTKKCKYCQSEIDYKASICPYCRKKQTTGSTIVAIFIVFLIIFGIINTLNKNNSNEVSVAESKETNTATIESGKSEYLSITSTELIDTFNENSVKCKKLYDKKLLEVTGTVQSVGEDVLGSIYVCLGHDTEFTFVGIQCYAKDTTTEDKIAELKEGDTITVRGKGDFNSLAFSLDKAEIVD